LTSELFPKIRQGIKNNWRANFHKIFTNSSKAGNFVFLAKAFWCKSPGQGLAFLKATLSKLFMYGNA
jgi:hypothetical protein